MKAIFYTDLHASLTKPSCRKDDYTSSIFSKLEQIDKIARIEKPDIILFGGDLCQKPVEDNRVFRELYKYYKNTFIQHKVIAGLSHDYYSSLRSGYDKSIMACLADTGVFEFVGEEFYFNLDGVKCYSGHYAILENPFFGHHVLYKDFNLDASVILTSHIHFPFPTKMVNNRTFISPGSLSRNSCDFYNQGRIPQIVMLNCINNKIDKIELIPLDVKLDIFDPKYILEKQQDKLKSKPDSLLAIESIQSTPGESMDVDALIRHTGSRFPTEALSEALMIKQRVENE